MSEGRGRKPGTSDVGYTGESVKPMNEIARKQGCEYCDPQNIDYYYAGKVPNYCKHCGRRLEGTHERN